MKNKRLYNFLVNTYGLSKELILELLDKRIDKLEIFAQKRADLLLSSQMQSSKMERFISEQVIKKLNEGFSDPNQVRSAKISLDNYIKTLVQEQIKLEVDKQLKGNFSLSINLKNE